jgi:single-stranded DNA-binding protein
MSVLTLTGYLGADREIRSTRERSYTATRYESLIDEKIDYEVTVPSRDYIRFSLATHQRVHGTWQTVWHRVLCWNADRTANAAARLLRKGDKVRLTGYIEEYSYTDRDGNPRTARHLILQNLEILKIKSAREIP